MKAITLVCSILLLLGLGISSCEPFLEKDISGKTIQLNAPQDNDTITSATVNFWWEEIKFSPNYRLQIVYPNFTNPTQLLLDTVVSDYTFTMSLNAGVYQWRVRGENTNSETPYSTRTLFVVTSQDLTSQLVVLKQPAGNVAFKDSLISFSWYSIPTATTYNFQILDSTGSVQFQQDLTNDSISVVFPLEGYFTWRVKAGNTLTETVYTSRSFYYDKTAPNQPALTFPTFNDTVSSGPVFLQWSNGMKSGSPITDSVFIYTDSLNTLSGIYYSTQASYQLTTSPGLYYWRVRSRDQAGNSSTYSNTFKFRAE